MGPRPAGDGMWCMVQLARHVSMCDDIQVPLRLTPAFGLHTLILFRTATPKSGADYVTDVRSRDRFSSTHKFPPFVPPIPRCCPLWMPSLLPGMGAVPVETWSPPPPPLSDPPHAPPTPSYMRGVLVLSGSRRRCPEVLGCVWIRPPAVLPPAGITASPPCP